MPEIHYKISPSATSRIEKCPGSLKLSEGIESVTTEYADEGTQAHSVGEHWLRVGSPPDWATEEQLKTVAIYVDFINKLREELTVSEGIEQTIVHPSIANFGGTADFYIVYYDTVFDCLVLHIVDYKHGAGVPVSPLRNRQLQSYCAIISRALGLAQEIQLYRGTIVQPRAYNVEQAVSTAMYSVEEIDEWQNKIIELIEESEKPTPKLCSGDHCRWCVAKKVCPAIQDAMYEVAKMEFSEVFDPSEDDINKLLMLRVLEPIIKATFKEIEESLLAHAKKGKPIPGHKVIQSLSNRKWILNDEETIKKLRNRKLKKSDYMEEVLKSPTKIEDALGPKSIEGLYHRTPGDYKLVPETAKGEACTFPAGEFDIVPNDAKPELGVNDLNDLLGD